MYSYYLLSTLGYKPSWGSLLTSMQMFQFVTMNVQAIYILTQGCAYPHPLTAFYLVYIISLFLLFNSFRMKRWGGKKSVDDKKASAGKKA